MIFIGFGLVLRAAGRGFATTTAEPHVELPGASFSGNASNGRSSHTISASFAVFGGRFDGSGNGELQVIMPASSNFLLINGRSFACNLAGLDVYGPRFRVNAGAFSNNSAYGFAAHSSGRVNSAVAA